MNFNVFVEREPAIKLGTHTVRHISSHARSRRPERMTRTMTKMNRRDFRDQVPTSLSAAGRKANPNNNSGVHKCVGSLSIIAWTIRGHLFLHESNWSGWAVRLCCRPVSVNMSTCNIDARKLFNGNELPRLVSPHFTWNATHFCEWIRRNLFVSQDSNLVFA